MSAFGTGVCIKNFYTCACIDIYKCGASQRLSITMGGEPLKWDIIHLVSKNLILQSAI